MRNQILAAAIAALVVTGAARAGDGPYRFVEAISIGGEGGWDYLSIGGGGNRLYVSHATKAEVVDLDRGVVVGQIADAPGIHGVIEVSPERIFTSNSREDRASIVDAKSLETIRKVETGDNPDFILYEPKRDEVYVFNAGSASATVIDATRGEPVVTIPLAGSPEAGVSDPASGRVFVNIEDRNSIDVIDTATHTVVANWPIAPGEEASGLAIDTTHHRLFVAAGNELMLMLDATNGRVVAQVPTGSGVDGAAFDPVTGYAFASGGDGTLTISREQSPDVLSVVQTLRTEPGARTIALDPVSHRVYLSTAKFEPPTDGGPGRGAVVPGSMHVLVYGLDGS